MIESIIELAKQIEPFSPSPPVLKIEQRQDGKWDVRVDCRSAFADAIGCETREIALATLRNTLVKLNRSQLQRIRDVLRDHDPKRLKLVHGSYKEGA